MGSPTSDVLRGTATSPTQFSATNTTTASTTSQRKGCAQMVLSSTPSAERESLAIITSTSTVVTGSNSSPQGSQRPVPPSERLLLAPRPGVCHIFYACVDG